MNAPSERTWPDLGAFDGDPRIKAFYLESLQECLASDGVPGPLLYAGRMNIPDVVVRLQAEIFKALPLALAKEFPHRFLSAIKPGADLTGVTSRLLIWMLVNPTHGVIRLTRSEEMCGLITTVAALHARRIADDEPHIAEWDAARSSAFEWMFTRSSAADRGVYDLSPEDRAVPVAYHCTFDHTGHVVTAFSVAMGATYIASPVAGGAYGTTVADKLIELIAATS